MNLFTAFNKKLDKLMFNNIELQKPADKTSVTDDLWPPKGAALAKPVSAVYVDELQKKIYDFTTLPANSPQPADVRFEELKKLMIGNENGCTVELIKSWYTATIEIHVNRAGRSGRHSFCLPITNDEFLERLAHHTAEVNTKVARDVMLEALPDKQEEKIVAWRDINLFRDEDDKWYLSALFLNEEPMKIEGTAECLGGPVKTEHKAPELTCHCGFYAVKQEHYCCAYLDNHSGDALAQVELSGKVIEHEKGYRAEKQTILALYLPRFIDGYDGNLSDIRNDLGIDVQVGFPQWVIDQKKDETEEDAA